MPLVGGTLMLVVWIGAINWRYPGGWIEAVAIGVVAVVYALAVAGYVAPETVGIPGE